MNPEEKAILKAIYDIPFEYPELINFKEIKEILFAETIALVNSEHLDISNYVDYQMYFGPKELIIMNEIFILPWLTPVVAKKAGFPQFATSEFQEKNPLVIVTLNGGVNIHCYKNVPKEIILSYRQNPVKWNVAFAMTNRQKIYVSIESYILESQMEKYNTYFWMICFQHLAQKCLEKKIDLKLIAQNISNISWRSSKILNSDNMMKKYEEFKVQFQKKIEILSKFNLSMEKSHFMTLDNKKIGNVFYTPVTNNIQSLIYYTMANKDTIIACLTIVGCSLIGYKITRN